MAIIWVDIWNSQNDMKAKCLIKRYFNISYYIATIRETNMNPDVSQYKNCWKQRYTMYTYHIHRSKYQKYNGP